MYPQSFEKVYPNMHSLLIDRLTVTCFGRIELPEDNPALGTYWMAYAVDLGVCTNLGEAMSLTERCIMQPHVSLIHAPGASDFAPNRILIRDSHHRLALGGKVAISAVEWCTPVTSDDEALRVRDAATELRVESAMESGWDNYSTAQGLEERAQLLEACLVDPIWQAEAANALRSRMTSVPTTISDSQH